MLVPRRVNVGKYTIVTWIRHGIVRLKLLTVSHFLTHFKKMSSSCSKNGTRKYILFGGLCNPECLCNSI